MSPPHKRQRRTPWQALSETQGISFTPTQTKTSKTDNIHHLTATPETTTPETTTPLIISNSAIRTAKQILHLPSSTNPTPPRSLLLLSPSIENELRAAQAASRQLHFSQSPPALHSTTSTPFHNRPKRFSSISAVTPIPLHLDSPSHSPKPQPQIQAPALFTTGSGKSLPLQNPKPKTTTTPPLFTTASGKTLKPASKLPFNIQSLFSPAPALPPPPSPTTPRLLPKSLFPDPPHNPSPFPLNKNKLRTRPTLKSTPFKPPRHLVRPAQSPHIPTPIKQSCSVPNIPPPPLLQNARFRCCSIPSHNCSNNPPSASVPLPSFFYSALTRPLQNSLNHVFSTNTLGYLHCLPPQLSSIFPPTLSHLSVQNLINWISTYFPTMADKPATCTGSHAWTKQVYSLAIWKLARLDMARNTTLPNPPVSKFLTAANLIREFLHRLHNEWHNNRQSHLLRIIRRDSSPASHVVLLIADIHLADHNRLNLLLTDGWVLATAILDDVVQRRVRRARIRVGHTVHVFGAVLLPVSPAKTFFFGHADELGTAALRICANNIRKRVRSGAERLGIQKWPMCTDSLSWLVDDGGQCPAVRVVLLRSYPVFYMECVTVKGPDDEEKHEYVFRREDAEFEARAKFQQDARQRYFAAVDANSTRPRHPHADLPDIEQRQVRCVKDLLICGIADDPTDSRLRKMVRVYNPSEDIQTCLAQEGQVLRMSQIWPKKNSWTCKPQGIMVPRGDKTSLGLDILSSYPRNLCSVSDLQCNTVAVGCEFDGVFCVIHVSEFNHDSGQRFAYFADNVGSDIRILALEMSGFDTQCLPRALRFKPGQGTGTRFPIVALTDVEFRAVSTKHELVHARATLRSSFIASKTLSRQRGKLVQLKQTLEQVETQVQGKEAQLEILREAVMSFSSGARSTIGAYFTSTQDM